MRTDELVPGMLASPPPYGMFPRSKPREVASIGDTLYVYGNPEIVVHFVDGTMTRQPPEAEWTVVEVASCPRCGSDDPAEHVPSVEPGPLRCPNSFHEMAS